MKVIVVFYLLLVGCSRPAPPPPVQQKPVPIPTVARPAEPPFDEEAARTKVFEYIMRCGMRSDISGLAVWLGNIGSAEVFQQQHRIDSIRVWSLNLADRRIADLYLNELAALQQKVAEAQDELTNHTIAKRQEIYRRQLAERERTAVKLTVPAPPCDNNDAVKAASHWQEQSR